MEYFIVLFGIRYDSHWRKKQFVAQAHGTTGIHPQPSPVRINISNQSLQIPNQSSIPNLPNVETPVKIEIWFKKIRKILKSIKIGELLLD